VAVLEENSEMNSVDTSHKRLRDEIATVEKEIQSHNQQIESLTHRLKGLKRADELFESDQAAIAELLQTSIANGSGITREMATVSAATMQRAAVSLKATGAQKQRERRTQVGRGKMQTGRGPVSQNGGLTRVDMIAAVLKRHRGLSLRELIAALNKEFGWNSTESHVTALLYTNQKKFAHTKHDRAANRPVTWSLK
jgi:chromosome segregation ATPase